MLSQLPANLSRGEECRHAHHYPGASGVLADINLCN